jgi:hypothetical protein
LVSVQVEPHIDARYLPGDALSQLSLLYSPARAFRTARGVHQVIRTQFGRHFAIASDCTPAGAYETQAPRAYQLPCEARYVSGCVARSHTRINEKADNIVLTVEAGHTVRGSGRGFAEAGHTVRGPGHDWERRRHGTQCAGLERKVDKNWDRRKRSHLICSHVSFLETLTKSVYA